MYPNQELEENFSAAADRHFPKHQMHWLDIWRMPLSQEHTQHTWVGTYNGGGLVICAMSFGMKSIEGWGHFPPLLRVAGIRLVTTCMPM